MRRIKYIASILVITFILIFTGEMYVWHLESFETEYISTTMYLPTNTTTPTMISDIEDAAQKHHCGIFTVNRKINNLFSEDITIYCTNGIIDSIKKISSVQGGKYHSLFLGRISVRLVDFDTIKDLSKLDTFYILGTLENAREFKKELVNTYSGSSPQEGYTYFNAKRNVVIVWIIGMLFLCLLTLYETSLLKKEMIIRFVYGDSLVLILLKRIFSDICIYMGSFLLAYNVFKSLLNISVDYAKNVSICCIIVLFLSDTIIYMRLLFVNYKSSSGHINGERKTLTISYIFSSCTVVVITLISSVCVGMAGEGVEYWAQKDFFKKYDNYNYISLGTSSTNIEQAEDITNSFLNKQHQNKNIFMNVYLGDGIRTGIPCLICNRNAIEYLEKQINLANQNLQGELYFLIPKKDNLLAKDDIIDIANMYIGDISNSKFITYSDNSKIIGINRQGNIISNIYKSPLIILDFRNTLSYFNTMYISHATMFNIDSTDWEQAITSPHISYNTSYCTNVYENYSYQLKEKQRVLLMGFTVLCVLLFIQAIIIKTILRYECIVNSTELVIKTTLGYSVLEKYQKIIINTCLTITFGVFGTIITSIIIHRDFTIYLLLGFITILLIYIALLFYYIRFIEKTKIQKLIKGSIL